LGPRHARVRKPKYRAIVSRTITPKSLDPIQRDHIRFVEFTSLAAARRRAEGENIFAGRLQEAVVANFEDISRNRPIEEWPKVVQLIEVTPDKKVVRALRSSEGDLN